jgi:tetratricopeptide (TPR) repeat protein
MTTIALDRVRWSDALAALSERYRSEGSPASRRLLADASSLSALFDPDFASAAERVNEALRLEPLNPLHRLRLALLHLRFGSVDRALDILRDLSERLRDRPLISYLRAMATLRQGEAKRAATIAADVLTAHPGYAPAQFLQAEADLRVQWKKFERRMPSLPADGRYAAVWADLLVKILAVRPVEGAKLVRSCLDRGAPPKGSREAAVVQRALAWSSDSTEDFARELRATPPGSRVEQAALLFFNDRLSATDKDGARLRRLRKLHELTPDRRAVRRLYVAALTQLAVDEARGERYGASLRAVEVCLHLEPHETIHYQNRAALFTLMVEVEAYHEGWADLDRHHYRLALLGSLDREAALRMTRPHRMFAQQARLTPEDPSKPRLNLGIFREERAAGDSPAPSLLTVNQQRIDADPEQLRQWIHHRRAELVFSHLALGPDAGRLLLHPEDAAAARARAEGLAALAESLPMLVPDEGRRLADLLSPGFRAAAAQIAVRYAAAPEDAEARQLSLRHLETLGDLALLCARWQVSGLQPELADELLDFVEAEAPFFDGSMLFQVLGDREQPRSQPLRFLAAYATATLELEEGTTKLTGEGRRRVIRSLCAALLVRLALRTFEELRERGAGGVERALQIIDRARRTDPDNAAVEYWAARLFTFGGFYEEARAALLRFHRLSGGDQAAYQSEVEELQRVLDQKKTAGEKGQLRTEVSASAEEIAETRLARADELEAELQRFPTSIQLHEELARALAANARFTEALGWAERSIARCLSRESQQRARVLHLEMTALQHLAGVNPTAARLYLAGTRSALLEAIEALPDLETRPYPVDYVLGACLLTAKRPEDAQRAFLRAISKCSRQMHLTVLRPLAFDIEHALMEQAHRAIADALNEGRAGDAFREAADTWARLSSPEMCLLDLARIQLAAAVAALGSGLDPAAPPPLVTEAPWKDRLRSAVAAPDALDRAEALARLAIDLHEPSTKDAESLLRKIEALREQIRVAEAVNDASRLLREGAPGAALTALEKARAAGEGEPRWLRLRVVLLLRLDRFAEADAAATELAKSRDPLAQELVEQYPGIRFRHRLGAVNRLLRAGDTASADAILADTGAEGPEQQLDWAYASAFSTALAAHRRLDDGAEAEAREGLSRAVDLLERHVALARERGHARLLELYAKLDKELSDLEEATR